MGAMRPPLSLSVSVLFSIILVHICGAASSQREAAALEETSATALLARTLSSLAKASKRSSQSSGRELREEDVTARAQQLLDTSVSNQLAIKAISNSLTPHRGDGSRFSYSASWGTLPECASQQVCSALYVRLNRTQPLCQCSNQFKDSCSKTDYVDEHSIKLISSSDKKKAYNLVKVCEPVMSIRRCKSPQDWQLLALQSTRTGKSHYLVVCRCPTGSSLLGPIKHNNPPYANIPGIRVYGMLCSQRRGNRQVKEKELPPVPWDRLLHLARQSGLTNITLPFS